MVVAFPCNHTFQYKANWMPFNLGPCFAGTFPLKTRMQMFYVSLLNFPADWKLQNYLIKYNLN